MNEGQAKELVDFVFKDVFARENPFSLDEIQRKFAFDVDIPERVKDSVTGRDTWSVKRRGVPAMAMETAGELHKKGTIPKPEKLNALDDVFKFWKTSAYFVGDRYINSTDVTVSDAIFDSNSVYRSALIHDCQKVVFSKDNSHCKQIVASKYNDTATSCIRALDSAVVTSCFAVMWSKKLTKCMYVNNCYDLYECMFCSNIDTRKYCICNMQFTKEEYEPLKQMAIDWTIKNFGKGNTMGF